MSTTIYTGDITSITLTVTRSDGTRQTFDLMADSVVAQDGKMVHDPHPDRTGLVGTEREIQLFVTLDPSRLVPGTA